MSKDLAKLGKNALVKEAEGMRRRAMRYKKNAETVGGRLSFAAFGGGTAFVMGYIMGGKEADYNKIVKEEFDGDEEAFRASGKSDPRTIMGLPFDATVSVLLWGIGITGRLGKTLSPALEAAGFGGLSGFLYNWGSEMALEGAAAAEEETP